MCVFSHLPPHPPTPPPALHPTHPPPSSAHSEISAHQKKTAKNAKNQALTEFKGFLYKLLGIVAYIGDEETTAN